jgi:hypothetical protein
MDTNSGDVHQPGGPEDQRAWAVEQQAGLGEEPNLGLSLAEPPRRRPLRTILRFCGYAAALFVLFVAGWLAEAAFNGEPSSSSSPLTDLSSPEELAAVLFPEDGITLGVIWGDIPHRLAQEGVIDVEKLKTAARRAGLPLTREQEELFSGPSDEEIMIDRSSAYFFIDVLWALGLADKNPIISEGPMAQSGLDQAFFASTGGWTLGEEAGEHYLSTLDLVPLSAEQQAVASEVAFGSYRPCCNNPTAYPDCNHGMAGLALVELLAAHGASANEIYEALKGVFPFWFPNEYHQLALYFERQGEKWADLDARLVLGRDYSSGQGWQQVSAWLDENGVRSDLPDSAVHEANFCAVPSPS